MMWMIVRTVTMKHRVRATRVPVSTGVEGPRCVCILTTCVTACSSVLSVMTSYCVKGCPVRTCVNANVWLFVCTANFSASSYIDLHYLDASGSGMTPRDLTHNRLLIHLRLSGCRIHTHLTLELPNLKLLDLSLNELVHIDMPQLYSNK